MNEEIAKAAHDKRLYEQRTDQLSHLTGPILRDLARNESASREWRKAAIVLMLNKHCPEVHHPDLASLLNDVMRENGRVDEEAKDEVQSIVESAIEAPLDEVSPVQRPMYNKPRAPVTGPFRASVTTKTMSQDDILG